MSLTKQRSLSFSFYTQAVLLAAICLALSGCTLKLIGDYDDVIDKALTDFQQKTETYMAKLESDPGTPYDGAFYDDAHARLASIRSRAQASFKKDILVQQVDELTATLNDFQKGDKSTGRKDGKMNMPFLGSSRQAIEVEIESMLKLELALKRGKDTTK